MGTPGSGRKRTPVKDRFSAEDEALSNIAREAEARLAAKRAARAEARDIRMRELERQQKENPSKDITGTHWSRAGTPKRKDIMYDAVKDRSSRLSSLNHSYSHSYGMKKRSSGSHKDPLLDEKSDKQYAENYTRPSSRNSASATTPLSGNSSRRGSGDTSSLVDPDTSLSELRESLSEVEEKYKKAMVSNAQLDNEKNNLIYQVDTLKDVIEEQEEQMAEFYRENEEKSKELERQKHMCSVLQHKMDELKEGLRQRDELIEKHGLVIIPDGTPNGDVSHEPVVGAITVVSQEAAQVLESAGEGPLDVRLRKLAGEKEELLSQIRRLKLQLEEERQKCSRSEGSAADVAGLHNGSDLQFIEMQRDANRQISDYKFKLSKAEQDITTLEQNISRLEGQVLRYKTAAENAEKVEDELKAEKRKLQRELRTALDKIEEMEMTNSHLAKRLEKMKANRTALLAQQ
ncbi:leucine-rich repeat flightless-interacting protein 2 isoform X9 [Ursus maritimus]|uniref:Leucine-rich repeat flightless-interacting protein 2 n=1 Tax=Ursus maritimus TaxID=29073 RepID=A0A8M1GDZ0_URSMA|nr:leucine-rich repeat flightless-interacting protein 2 isoform X9 [Ursus maritimus]